MFHIQWAEKVSTYRTKPGNQNFGPGTRKKAGPLPIPGRLFTIIVQISDHHFILYQTQIILTCFEGHTNFIFRHAGDLGNVEAENGKVAVAVVDRIVTLDPTQPTIIGQKAIVRVAIWDFG